MVQTVTPWILVKSRGRLWEVVMPREKGCLLLMAGVLLGNLPLPQVVGPSVKRGDRSLWHGAFPGFRLLSRTGIGKAFL